MYICHEIRHFSLCQCVQVIILDEMVKLFEIVGKASTFAIDEVLVYLFYCVLGTQNYHTY